MDVRGWSGALIRAGEWIIRLGYVNLLWVLFTLFGAGVLGLFPATAALFAVIRKWLLGEEELPVFRTFWQFYRADWIRMNGLMLIYSVMGWGLILDIRLVRGWEGWAQPWVIFFLMFALLIYLLSLLHLFPLYVHYRLKLHDYVLQAFRIALSRPLESALMAGAAFLVYVGMMWMPGTLPVFGASLPAGVIMAFAFRIFRFIAPRTVAPKPAWTGSGRKNA
jgi:uncharacterized membrane protein YesL